MKPKGFSSKNNSSRKSNKSILSKTKAERKYDFSDKNEGLMMVAEYLKRGIFPVHPAKPLHLLGDDEKALAAIIAVWDLYFLYDAAFPNWEAKMPQVGGL